MMVEVLNILSIATKQVGFPSACIGIGITNHWSEKYLKRLLGKTDTEGTPRRLDEFTPYEVWMATDQLMKIAHIVSDIVILVFDSTRCVILNR